MPDEPSLFTGIADWQAGFRPVYPAALVELITAALARPLSEVAAVDIGAGAGRWTKQLAGAGIGKIAAVEPNERMRGIGARLVFGPGISWHGTEGTATGLPSGSFDLVTWASSFHHAELGAALDESTRLLAPDGCIAILSQGRHRTVSASSAPHRGAIAVAAVGEALASRFPQADVTIVFVEERLDLTATQAEGYLRAVAHLQRPESAAQLEREHAALRIKAGQVVNWRFVHSAVLAAGAGREGAKD